MKPPPTREEAIAWVNAYRAGEDLQDIAARVGRKPHEVNARLMSHGCYLFERPRKVGGRP